MMGLVADPVIPGPGTLLGERYRLDSLLGEGAFSQVYRASDLNTNEEVALKLLAAGSVEVSGLERLRREATLAQKLEHPNSVRLLDFDLESTTPFLVYELLEGETLERLLGREGPISEAGVVVMASQVLMAVREAHSLGIVHRDIKPANVFICRGVGLVKVLDFGIARTTSSGDTPLTAAGLLIGTPRYMPPEQVRGADPIPAMDVYAIGMMMAEMLTGEPVLRGAAVDACLAQLQPTRIELPERVESSGLGSVVHRATEKDLALRYANAAEMLAALRRVAPGASSEAPAPREARAAQGAAGTGSAEPQGAPSTRPPRGNGAESAASSGVTPSRDSLAPTELMPNPELVLGSPLAPSPAPTRTASTMPPAAAPRSGGVLGWLGATAALLILAIAATAIVIYVLRTAPGPPVPETAPVSS